MTAWVTGPHGVKIPILGKGSRFGSLLPPAVLQQATAYRRKPGTMQVRLRLNARTLLPGAYTLRIVAVDPWGRHGRLSLRFRYR
jgi:hypothetical protein